ncbi:MAG: TIGR04086 family membrane protein [Lachnospiraceae bacterium]|nr:TIGR04086 family membrane protein [Lachnospiraceae bacterium]
MKKKVLCIVAMLISMCLATIVSILLLSYIFFKMEISEDKIIIGTLIIYFISCFIGGFIYGKIKEKNKYIHGMSIGAIYFVVLLLISVAFSKDFSLISVKTLYSGLTCILGGMLGGMLS